MDIAVNFRERSFFVNFCGAVVNYKIAATLFLRTPKDNSLPPKTGTNLCYVKFKLNYTLFNRICLLEAMKTNVLPKRFQPFAGFSGMKMYFSGLLNFFRAKEITIVILIDQIKWRNL